MDSYKVRKWDKKEWTDVFGPEDLTVVMAKYKVLTDGGKKYTSPRDEFMYNIYKSVVETTDVIEKSPT